MKSYTDFIGPITMFVKEVLNVSLDECQESDRKNGRMAVGCRKSQTHLGH